MFLPANIIQTAFGPLISLFAAILVGVHNAIGGSWGLAIIGLTIIVRVVLFPLTMKQFRSMQKMQTLAPQMQVIKEKYKDDKERQSQEMMKLYRENGANPAAACLPLLLQLPVFISLFYALRQNLKTDICGPAMVKHFSTVLHPITSVHQLTAAQIQSVSCNQVAPGSAKFLFIPDITAQATGWVLVVLLVLYIGSQLATTLIISGAQDKNQKRLMIALPLVFTLFIFRFPAGLLVYWITTNLWTLGQQIFIRRQMGGPTVGVPATAVAGAGGSGGGGGSGSAKPKGAPSPASNGDGGGTSPPASKRDKTPSGVGAPSGAPSGRPSGPPPRSPRTKKKRSGRRR